jgi:hypothetical protein
MGRRSLALLLCLAVALLAGCGSERDQEAARVAARFYSAVAAKDGAAACSQLSEDAVAKLESEEKASCPEAVLELDLKLPAGRERSTDVYLTSAKVDLAGADSVFLDQTNDGWRISAAGCRPQAGEEKPYECEVEA